MQKFRSLPSAVRLPLLAYRLLFPLVLTVLLPGYLLRMVRRGQYAHKFGQRLGFYSAQDSERLGGGGWLWIHAVSVGEMMMGLHLARTILSENPAARILLSTTTSTGYAIAREQIARDHLGFELIYYPIDWLPGVRRTLRLLRPAQLVMVDKELWPNMVAECYREGIPVSIVNARLSPKSERGFRKWSRWTAPFFGMIECVCVQEPEDLPRWEALGVRREALHCTGSLKYDFAAGKSVGTDRSAEFSALLAKLDVTGETPVLLGGSTFPGEEAILGRVLLKLRARWPDLFLIVVPRHVERTPEVETELRGLGLTVMLRKNLSNIPPHGARPDVLIVNTTGELRDWYAHASVCFVGKSLTAIGGQNPAEPVLVGRPVVFGPHMENFEALVRQLLAGKEGQKGALQVNDEEELARCCAELLANPAQGQALVAAARGVLETHLGANLRTARLLDSFVG